jgi:hypothetical protein
MNCTGDPISTIIRDIIMSLAAMFTAYFAYRGIDAWKKEYVGKRQVRVIDKLLRSVYSLRREVSRIRWSGIDPKQYPDKSKILNAAQDKMLICAEHAEALFGKEVREKVQEINFLINSKLLLRIQWFLANFHRETAEERMEDLNILFENREDDPFAKELNEKIEAVESIVRPYIKF